MQQTYSSRLEHEFVRLVEKTIEASKEELSYGFATDSEYRRITGYIHGLRTAIELIREADTKLQQE